MAVLNVLGVEKTLILVLVALEVAEVVMPLYELQVPL